MENNNEYFLERCAEIGLTPELNILKTPEFAAVENSAIFEFPIMAPDENGNIIIPIYTLQGLPAVYYKDNTGKLQSGKEKPLEIIRFKPGNEKILTDKKTGKEKTLKYQTPAGAKALPWISPNIIQAYRTKTPIDTIVITEGQIKAMAGWVNGLHIFGLNGFTNIASSQKNNRGDVIDKELHKDILAVITELKVKNVVLLFDGDCVQIKTSQIVEEKDLRNRPLSFYLAANNMRELLKDYFNKYNFDLYCAHVNSTNLDGEPKGLDDLFTAFSANANDIVSELQTFSRKKNHYFFKTYIKLNANELFKHLQLNGAKEFYLQHSKAIAGRKFVYNGTKYEWDDENGDVKIIVPGEAKQYFRVGTEYYKFIKVPDKYGALEQRFVKWTQSTIVQDHGKNIVTFVPKYEAFCSKPDHFNYEQIINSCFNRYMPFEHEVGENTNCPVTMHFLKHIFDDQLQYGLDYIQLLLQNPQQMLPILCLVSKETNTGKSTFVKLLKAIFTSNCAIIGNADFENDFNASWADKLIIACEESFIDKKPVSERLKALSTGDKIFMNQKGVQQFEVDFFGKFILCSNFEKNFAMIDEQDSRYWVRKIKPIPKTELQTDMLDAMIHEIPSFLCYLQNRVLFVKEKEFRSWFDPEKLRTDAWHLTVGSNIPSLQKELVISLKELFLSSGFWRINLKLEYIHKNLLNNKSDRNYLLQILHDRMGYKSATTTKRFSFPELQKTFENNTYEITTVVAKDNGRPYTFFANELLTPDELAEFYLSETALREGQADLLPEEFKAIELNNRKQNVREELPF